MIDLDSEKLNQQNLPTQISSLTHERTTESNAIQILGISLPKGGAIIILISICFLSSCCTVNKYSSITPSADDNYTELIDEVSSEYRMIGNGPLKFRYRELYEFNQLSYNIYDNKNKVVQTQIDEPVSIRYGTNYINLPLSNLSSGRFILEVVNTKNRKKYLHFYLK